MRRFRTFGETKKRGGIPADCVEVEYLEFTGTQYIDTGVTIASDISFTINCSKTSSSTSAYIIGALQGSQILLSCGFQFQIGGGRTASVAADTSPHVVECSFEDAMTIDGRSYPFTTQPSTTAISGRTMYVGCRNLRGVTDGFATVTIYSLVIRKAGTVVLDLVPVRRIEGGVSVGYMCDKLTGQLYGNAGTGSFVIGPDKYDAEVEWIESDGTQWVETNQPADPRNLPLEIGFSAIDNKYVIGGGPSSSEGFGISVASSSGTSVSVKFGWNTNLYYWNNERTAPYHITGVTLVDGSYRYRLNERHGNGVTAGTYADTMVLFGRKVGCSVEPSAVRIYYAKVGSRDFIPVRYRGVGFLYDKVSGRLFGNQGSGEFVIGADVTPAEIAANYAVDKARFGI